MKKIFLLAFIVLISCSSSSDDIDTVESSNLNSSPAIAEDTTTTTTTSTTTTTIDLLTVQRNNNYSETGIYETNEERVQRENQEYFANITSISVFGLTNGQEVTENIEDFKYVSDIREASNGNSYETGVLYAWDGYNTKNSFGLIEIDQYLLSDLAYYENAEDFLAFKVSYIVEDTSIENFTFYKEFTRFVKTLDNFERIDYSIETKLRELYLETYDDNTRNQFEQIKYDQKQKIVDATKEFFAYNNLNIEEQEITYWINYSSTRFPGIALSLCEPNKTRIVIDAKSFLLDSPYYDEGLNLRSTVWHELGHEIYHLAHESEGIMSYSKTPETRQEVYEFMDEALANNIKIDSSQYIQECGEIPPDYTNY
jgi:hypothetical protein